MKKTNSLLSLIIGILILGSLSFIFLPSLSLSDNTYKGMEIIFGCKAVSSFKIGSYTINSETVLFEKSTWLIITFVLLLTSLLIVLISSTTKKTAAIITSVIVAVILIIASTLLIFTNRLVVTGKTIVDTYEFFNKNVINEYKMEYGLIIAIVLGYTSSLLCLLKALLNK